MSAAPTTAPVPATPDRAAHDPAQVRAIVERALGGGRLRSRWDARRGLWQAWLDAATFARARVRGEWTSEAGALRQLLDVYLHLRAGGRLR